MVVIRVNYHVARIFIKNGTCGDTRGKQSKAKGGGGVSTFRTHVYVCVLRYLIFLVLCFLPLIILSCSIRKDLTDPMLSMQYPFSLLRCLSLWKPPTHNWGYDLITSGFMRFSNEQMDLMDISDRLVPRFDDFHYPEWLRGPLLWTADDYRVPKQYRKPRPTQKEALKAFIGGTIYKTNDFLRDALQLHLACVSDQSEWFFDLRHHGITSVDAGGAIDTLHL